MDKTISTAPTPYLELNAVLGELVESAQVVLGESFVAAGLQGSFALGEFDRHSDVDFIIVVEEELSENQVLALQIMHEQIFNLECEWARHLEGSYFPKDVLRDYAQRGKPLWYLDNGSRSLIESGHDNTVVVRWVMREHGVTLAGPSPATLVDEIPVAAFRQEILEGMNIWGKQILAKPEIINNRFYQTFAVLHYCRMLHDLHTGFPGSKRAGTEWAKANLDMAWAGLIDRAWNGRPNPTLSSRQPADPEDLKSTVAFVRYIIEAGELFALDESDDKINA
jgi:predicted nucleotidyltransferase